MNAKVPSDDFLIEYELALRAKADAEVKIALLEMQFRILETTGATREKSEIEVFIDANRRELEHEDIAFLTKSERLSCEVAEYLEVHQNRISERLRDGIYLPGRLDKPRKRSVDTLSVVRSQIG